MANQPDALRALQQAQKDRQEQAKRLAKETFKAEIPDLDYSGAIVRLAVFCYAYGVTFGMGALPDGSGIYGRVRVPIQSGHPCAGMVAFVVSDDPLTVLLKALAALDSAPESNFWKVDQYATK